MHNVAAAQVNSAKIRLLHVSKCSAEIVTRE